MRRGFSIVPIFLVVVLAFLSLYYFYTQKQKGIVSPEPQPTVEPASSGTPTPLPSSASTPAPTTNPTTQSKNFKVLLLIYNPIFENQGGMNLVQLKNWNNPDSLTQSFIKSVKEVSHGFVNYQIATRLELDDIPLKSDGFDYNDDTYLNCLNNGGCHNPDLANYKKMIEDSGACEKRNKGEIDELWIWGGPYFGYWESNLAGPEAFWYNSSPTGDTGCTKLLPIMGFNYERGEAEMFEDLGHRLESTMTKVYGSWAPNEDHSWNKFTLLDVDAPGRGGCGNAHLAVNAGSNQGYDRESPRSVESTCDDFLNYPNLTGQKKSISCTNWGCTTLGYFKWWFFRLPNKDGTSLGKLNNWWTYITNPQEALSK